MSDIDMIMILRTHGYSSRHIDRMLAFKNTGVRNDC